MNEGGDAVADNNNIRRLSSRLLHKLQGALVLDAQLNGHQSEFGRRHIGDSALDGAECTVPVVMLIAIKI